MSVLSDSTDVLLVIPPNFFTVSSDSEDSIVFDSDSKQLLVSDLISQVNDLEGRICCIENHSIFSNNSMPLSKKSKPAKCFGSLEALDNHQSCYYNYRSLQSTPVKASTLPLPCKNWQLEMNLSENSSNTKSEQSRNLLKSTEYLYQKERDDQLLSEINNFFTKKEKTCVDINNHEKIDGTQISEATLNENSSLSSAVFNLNKVNDLLKKLEDTQNQIEQKLKLKNQKSHENELLEIQGKKPSSSNSKAPNVLGDESHDEENFFKNSLNNDCTKDSSDVVNSKLVERNINECNKYSEISISIPTKDDNNFKTLEENSVENTSNGMKNLLSLGELWENARNIGNTKNSEDLSIYKQKYLEEEYRRQHCEKVIQSLQLKLLEEQQKVAVAVKVDKEKDETIIKLSEGWNKLLNHWQELEIEKNNLEKKLQEEREKFESEVSAACQTVKRYELELSKALDLAHDYKEKCEISENDKKKLNSCTLKEISVLKNELKEIKNKLQNEERKNEKLEAMILSKESNLKNAKHADIMKALSQQYATTKNKS